MKKILVVNADYYKNISSLLIDGAKKVLKDNKIKLSIINVPGVFEIPVTISRNIKKFDAFIALGCVIKGDTPHFSLICNSTFDALMKISVDSKKPIGNGIITCLNMKQAKARKKKGAEAAKAVISILSQK